MKFATGLMNVVGMSLHPVKQSFCKNCKYCAMSLSQTVCNLNKLFFPGKDSISLQNSSLLQDLRLSVLRSHVNVCLTHLHRHSVFSCWDLKHEELFSKFILYIFMLKSFSKMMSLIYICRVCFVMQQQFFFTQGADGLVHFVIFSRASRLIKSKINLLSTAD